MCSFFWKPKEYIWMYFDALFLHKQEWWPSGRVSASKPVGRGFESWPSHTKDFKNGTHSLPSHLALDLWEWSGKVKLAKLPVDQPPPPAVAFTAFADAWPRAIDTEIDAALCAIGRGKGLWLLFHFFISNKKVEKNNNCCVDNVKVNLKAALSLECTQNFKSWWSLSSALFLNYS